MNRKIRGIRDSIPPGYILGRTGTGNGPVGLIKITDLIQTSAPAIVAQAGSVLGANPSAVGGDVAINGTATTFMRSDGAFAIQLGSSSVYGIVKVDGTTIISTGGVLSAAAGGGGGAMLPLVNGDLPGPSAIADDKGQFIGVPL